MNAMKKPDGEFKCDRCNTVEVTRGRTWGDIPKCPTCGGPRSWRDYAMERRFSRIMFGGLRKR